MKATTKRKIEKSINNILIYYNDNNETPSLKTCVEKELLLVGGTTIKKYYVTWNNFIESIGIPVNEYVRNNEKVKVKCKQCGKETSNPIFCNRSCSAKFNNSGIRRHGKSPRKKCLFCQKPIALDNSTQKHCNRACFNLAKKKKYHDKMEKAEDLSSFGTRTIKKYLKKKFGSRCGICKRITWNKKNIPLILDHMDGNPYNNNKNNLRLVCPNCDAQLPTYKGKNMGNGRHYRRKRYKEGKSY